MTDLLYSDVEESLRESVRSLLTRRLEPNLGALLYDQPKTDTSFLWHALAQELGIAALLIPEQLGGAGATAREAAIVLEELGRTVAPVPFLTSSVVATSVLLAADSEYAKTLAEGSSTAVLVLPWSCRRGAWNPVSGPVSPVAGAIGADLFIFPVQFRDRVELRVYTASEVQVNPLTSFDMTRQLAQVVAHGQGELLLTGSEVVTAVDTALGAGQALLASEQFGVAQWCLEATTAYAKNRIQFGRPVGSFQAVKHRLADLYLEVVQCQAAARYAADTLTRGDADRFIAQAVAQSYCSDVAVHAAEEALQLHGGIGMTWEHPVHLYLKRAKSDQLALGTPARHRTDLGTLVDLTV